MKNKGFIGGLIGFFIGVFFTIIVSIIIVLILNVVGVIRIGDKQTTKCNTNSTYSQKITITLLYMLDIIESVKPI